MKIIFLDIDGVLNSTIGKGPYASDMEVDKLVILHKLVDESGADGVVITSDRRYSVIDMKNKLSAFSEYGIPFVGATRLPNQEDLEDNRGKQILDYLSISEAFIDKIAILDDNDDGISCLFLDDFVQVNSFYGLNAETYSQALKALQ